MPAIEHVADMLGMAYIRALEVATFYFMFQLSPVGSVAHVQICGTTSCMICGAEELIAVCKELIAPGPHQVSADGKFSWEEVECLGACVNAPMIQINDYYYEDLSIETLEKIVDEIEGRLAEKAEREMPSAEIGELIMERLHEIDEVAYVRFASVYREFKDVSQFVEEVKGLREGGRRRSAP
mgnify:CR=1 FL=1